MYNSSFQCIKTELLCNCSVLLTPHVTPNILETPDGTQVMVCGSENELNGMFSEMVAVYAPVDSCTNIGIHLMNGNN